MTYSYTYTHVLLEVSEQTWNEIAEKLRQAGYGDAIDGGEIDMHGLVLKGPTRKDVEITIK